MSANLKPFIARLAAGETMTDDQAEAAFDIIMSGEATPAQIGALLMAMRLRGETVSEITGAVRAMRARMIAIEAPAGAIDVCGTGGDGAGTLNVSSAVTFVVAGCGVPVAKHGNRALSSRTGGADVLTALGVNVDAPMAALPSILAEAGCVFLFAPRHHPSMRHAAGPRVELATRTIFNLLGPLANPARVKHQLTGVFAPDWTRPMAETLAVLGHETAWIVHGMGLDELTLAGHNEVTALHAGKISSFVVEPEDAGLPRAPIEAILGGDAGFNAAALEAVLQNTPGAYHDTVLLNAAAALIVAGQAGDLREGVSMAAGSIASGAAFAALETLRRVSAVTVS
ncbi:MAG: anthranilate phosphoribosyltransferase [Acetobacteraceae bacterium]|jgi:anthranilate phosphoribosyltransferase|nr:anthranilate phosphoribosyltransferase [Acetobacteraceae bacterium]MEA2771259.1 anthranilate phosphoribosyltransferase [Acetobacteraceae bacterium]